MKVPTFQGTFYSEYGGKLRHHFRELLYIAFPTVRYSIKSFERLEKFAELRERWKRKWLSWVAPEVFNQWKNISCVLMLHRQTPPGAYKTWSKTRNYPNTLNGIEVLESLTFVQIFWGLKVSIIRRWVPVTTRTTNIRASTLQLPFSLFYVGRDSTPTTACPPTSRNAKSPLNCDLNAASNTEHLERNPPHLVGDQEKQTPKKPWQNNLGCYDKAARMFLSIHQTPSSDVSFPDCLLLIRHSPLLCLSFFTATQIAPTA